MALPDAVGIGSMIPRRHHPGWYPPGAQDTTYPFPRRQAPGRFGRYESLWNCLPHTPM